MRTSRAHVTPRINTEAFVGQGSTMVTVLSKKIYIIKLKYLFFFVAYNKFWSKRGDDYRLR